MYPKSFQQQVWQALALVLTLSFLGHLIWDELPWLLPVLAALAIVLVVYRFVLKGWRR
jgi:hypothetical protein